MGDSTGVSPARVAVEVVRVGVVVVMVGGAVMEVVVEALVVAVAMEVEVAMKLDPPLESTTTGATFSFHEYASS